MTTTATRRSWVDIALWALGITAACATVVLSLLPPDAMREVRLSDKVLHAAAYGAIALPLLLAAVWRPGRGDGRFPRGAVVVVLATVGLGFFIELIQRFFGRSTDIKDGLADLVGVLLVTAGWWFLRRSPFGGNRRTFDA